MTAGAQRAVAEAQQDVSSSTAGAQRAVSPTSRPCAREGGGRAHGAPRPVKTWHFTCDNFVKVLCKLVLYLSILGIVLSLAKDLGIFLGGQVFEWVVDRVCGKNSLNLECIKMTAAIYCVSLAVIFFFLIRAFRRVYCRR